MELNKDCVRDVLLCCERLLKMNDNGFMNDLSLKITKRASRLSTNRYHIYCFKTRRSRFVKR